MKNKFFYLAVLVACALFSGSALARPLDAPPTEMYGSGGFTNASLQGNYALMGFAGGDVGGVVGIVHFDGNGHYTGTYTGNFPGENGTRQVTPNIHNKGEYTVNPDGTGTIHEFETLEGVTTEYNDDIVILDAEAIGPYVVATEIFGLVRQTDPSGVLLTLHLDRLPDMGMAPTTSVDKEALMHRFYDAFNARNWDALNELMAADVVDHNPVPDQPEGLAGVKMALAGFHAAFPDIQIAIEQILVAGDYVTVRQVARGTHDGEFLGIPATGKPVTITSHDIYRVEDGTIVEVWHTEDLLNTLFQVEAFPPASK